MARKPARASKDKPNKSRARPVNAEAKVAFRRDMEQDSTLQFRIDVLISETIELSELSSEICHSLSIGVSADPSVWKRWQSCEPELAEWWRCSGDLLEDVTVCLDRHKAPESVRPKLHRIADIVRAVRSAVGGYELDPPRNRSPTFLHTGYCAKCLEQAVHDLSDLRPLLPEDFRLSASSGEDALTNSKKIPEYARKALEQFNSTVERMRKEQLIGMDDVPEDREVHNLLVAGKKTALPFESWARYLRKGRNCTGQQKHKSRSDRLKDKGRSIVGAEEI